MIDDVFEQIVRRYPERMAVVEGARRFTFQEVYDRKHNLAQYFANCLKIRKGEKIALFLPNSAEFVSCFFAGVEIGATSVPLNIHLKEAELQYYVKKCEITAVVTNSDLRSQWGKLPRQIEAGRFVLIDKTSVSEENGKTISKKKGQLDGYGTTDFDRDILFLGTSGTTGTPKIVPRTDANLVAGAKNVSETLGVTHEDRFLSVVPFYHANGFSNCMFLPLMNGATIIPMRQFAARKMIEIIRQEDVSIVFGSPFIFSVMCDVVGDECILPSVRHYLSTGAPMLENLRKTFLGKFGQRLRHLYGSSETGTISIQTGDISGSDDSMGRPIRGVDLRVVSKDGNELPADEKGELVVRSPAMTRGYWNESEPSDRAFHNGYFRTGDLGMLDAQGRLYITGRKKRVINAAGVKVDPVEVENVLLSYDKVKEAFVFGVTNKRGAEIIKAIIVAEKECNLSEVIGYCKARLADYKVPRVVDFKDNIPRDILGKVLPVNMEG